MADACFPAVRSLTEIESKAIMWVDVDFGGHADPQSALEAVRWYCREKGYKHFLRVRFRPSPPSYKDNGIYTFVLRDASTARLWRDVLMDPNLDPPGLRIDRNGTPKPFTMPRNQKGQPSLGKLFHALKKMGGIIDDKLLRRTSEENIDAWVRDRCWRQPSDADDGSGGGGGSGSSSQTVITSSPTNQPAAAASAGSPPAASALSDTGMTPQDTAPHSSPFTTPDIQHPIRPPTLQRQQV